MNILANSGKVLDHLSTTYRKVLFLSLLVLVATMTCPASAQYQVFWGDVHGHTSHSDGKGSLDDYFIHARDVSKLDFVIVTDHDFGNGTPTWRMPKEAWILMQNKADEYTVGGKFIAMAGYEWTSQSKYWSEVGEGMASEGLFIGSPKFYNHKNVYFPGKIDTIFSAKDLATMSPNLLAEVVQKHGGLIQNNHPSSGPDGKDQWDYAPIHYSVITNTEMYDDTIYYEGKTYHTNMEQAVRDFLDHGGKTGFVRGTDTHEGKPAARTAVLAKALTRDAIFEALRHRRNYAVSNARIVLSFKIDGHDMGEEIDTAGQPEIAIDVQGTDTISEVVMIRNGTTLYSLNPAANHVTLRYVDRSFDANSYYYLRVTQVDTDEYGNASRAWSSPIWVNKKVSARSSF